MSYESNLVERSQKCTYFTPSNFGHKVRAELYDKLEQGVGRYFKSSILTEIDLLHLFAGIHPIRYRFYCMLAKRFPFAIYYLVEDKLAKIVAVLDLRRDPKWIRYQLNKMKI